MVPFNCSEKITMIGEGSTKITAAMNAFKSIQLLGLLFLFAFNSNAQTCVAVSPTQPWTWPGHNNWFFGPENTWQGQTYKWAPVSPGPLAPATTPQGTIGVHAVSYYEGNTAASDDNGNLLFFSNGRNLWDASGTGIAKYTGLLEGNENGALMNGSAVQGVITVRHPLNPNKYYIFTTDDANSTTVTNGFNYFVFDQNGNNIAPLGPNRLGAYRTMEGVAATRHANGVDIWITSYESGTNNFNSYLLTCSGLNTTPVVSAVAPMINSFNEERGGIAFSWDGKRFAQVHPNSTGGASDKEVSVYDFNNTTGVISNPLNVSSIAANELPYDVLFSPDNSKLYYSTALGQVGYYDISSGVAATILATQTFLTITAANTHAAIEIGPDGTLYQADGGNGQPLRKIAGNLNAGGAGAFTLSTIAGTQTSKGLPTMYLPPQDYLHIPAAGPICNTSGTKLNLSANWLCAGTNAEDPVGNPTGWSGSGITDAANGIFDPSGLAAGPYVITYTYSAACATVTATVTITVTSCAVTCGDTTLSASIPNICSGAGTFDLATYNGTSAPGTWSILTGPAGYTATIAGNGHTFNFNNTLGGTYTVRHTLTTVGAGCPDSASRSFTVYSASVGGTVTLSKNVCSGSNSGTLHLAGETGLVTSWQSSTNNFATATTIANTTDSLLFTNIGATTQYRAIVKSATCSSDTSAFATITADPVTVAGTVTLSKNVCSGSNSGVLHLAGETGSVTSWQSSTNNFATSTTIANTTDSLLFTNIGATTEYRAIVKSGTCSSDTAAFAIITADPVTVAGTVTLSKHVCSGANSDTLHLTGNIGSITSWQSSTNNFATSTTIANTTDSLVFTNIAATTKYRAIVKSGTCSSDTAVFATITVDPTTVGGTVTLSKHVCSGANSDTLHLTGSTGSVTSWQSSTDNFGTSTTIANITDSLIFTNLATTTEYRAVVKSGTCSSDTALFATITIDSVSVGGIVTADTSVCFGSNSGTLHLTGNTGIIKDWESSTDGFITKTTIPNTTATQTYTDLVVTTKYRAIVKSGTCASDSATAATITVNALPKPSIANDTICSGDTATFDAGSYSSYLWSDNGTGTSETTHGTVAGNYTCQVTDINGCKASATGVLTINALPVVSLPDTSVCPGGSITLVPSPALWNAYDWSTNLTTSTIPYNLPNTTVWVKVTDANGCSDTAFTYIKLGDTLHVDFGAAKEFCSYSSVTLDAAQYGPFSPPVVYTWDNVVGTSTKTINQSGQYGVTVMDGRGCMGSDTVKVTVDPAPKVSLGKDTTVCFTGHEQWLGIVADTFSTVLWSNGSKDTSTFIEAISDVWVKVSNKFTCVASDTVHVGEFCNPTPLCFPDVITPNNDGFNDIFTPCLKNFIKIDNGNYKGVIDNIIFVDFLVYDRWGIKLFESKDVIPSWDATFQGSVVASGTYYYIVRYTDSSKVYYEKTGFVTVMNH